MKKKSSPNKYELRQWIIDKGYTRTVLRSSYQGFGTILPLARKLLPDIVAATIVNRRGIIVTKEAQVMEALCRIRGRSTRKPYHRHVRPVSTETEFTETIVVKGDLNQALSDLLNAAGNVEMLATKIQQEYTELRKKVQTLIT